MSKELNKVVNEKMEEEESGIVDNEELAEFIPTDCVFFYDVKSYKKKDGKDEKDVKYRDIYIKHIVGKKSGLGQEEFEIHFKPVIRDGETSYIQYRWLDFMFEGGELLKLYFKRVDYTPEGETEAKTFYKPFVLCETDLGYIKCGLKVASSGDSLGFELIKSKYLKK